MEQIQQHEWEWAESVPKLEVELCPHCLVLKLTGIESVSYMLPDNEETYLEEPACITRYQEQHITKFEQAIKETAEEAGKS